MSAEVGLVLVQVLFFGIANVQFAHYILGDLVWMYVDVVFVKSVGRGWFALLKVVYFGIDLVLFVYFNIGGHVLMDVDVVLDESFGRDWHAFSSILILRY